MKFHSCLVILLAVIAKSTMAISIRTGIEPVEPASVDLNTAEVNENGSSLRKRNQLRCTTDCGGPSIQNCNAVLKRIAELPADTKICAKFDTVFINTDDCMFNFVGPQNNKVDCISPEAFSAASLKLFNHCMNNTAVGFGGCIDLGETGHVCNANINIKDLNTCV